MSGALLLRLLMSLFMFPATSRHVRSFYARALGLQLMLLLMAVVWLITPFALWKAYGLWSMLAWLLPTSLGVFAITRARRLDGG